MLSAAELHTKKMQVILKTGFEKISHSLPLKPQSEKRGKKLHAAGHVLQVEEFRKNGVGYMIQCKVVRQMSVGKEQYQVVLFIDGKRVVQKAQCTCVYNRSEACKHITALISFINTEESNSKTNNEQIWGRPSMKEFAKQKFLLSPSTLQKGLPNPSHLRLVVLQMQRDPIELAEEVAENDKRREEKLNEKKRLKEEKCRACISTLPIFSDKYFPLFSNQRLCLSESIFNFYKNTIVLPKSDPLSRGR